MYIRYVQTRSLRYSAQLVPTVGFAQAYAATGTRWIASPPPLRIRRIKRCFSKMWQFPLYREGRNGILLKLFQEKRLLPPSSAHYRC